MKHTRYLLFTLSCVMLLNLSASCQEVIMTFTNGLSVPLVGSYGREAVFTDEFMYRYSIDSIGDIKEGEVFTMGKENEDIRWEKLETDDKDWFKHRNLRGGYLVCEFIAKSNRNLILEANGHSEVFVNGELRGGDIYGFGWVQHPVKIRKGKNTLIFRGGRGRIQAKLVSYDNSIFLSDRDLLMPDLVAGDTHARLGAVRVINATDKKLAGYRIEATIGNNPASQVDIPSIPAYSSRKVPFSIKWTQELVTKSEKIILTLINPKNKPVYSSTEKDLKIQIKNPVDKHKETFISKIDGSVQYFSIVPPINGQADSLALFFTLHGASVEAVNQANAYQAKDWGTLVAPTNRRPYGFDWEDWGRMDAKEVLQLAIEKYKPDPQRMYLTGHSMGGHGTWQVGATFPGYWAAIGPSAGWYSFWSYGGKSQGEEDDEIAKLIKQSTLPSNTIGLSRNYLQYGVYVLHGDKDDNVPVEQARFMREHLGKFHADFTYYERTEAGHWWGNECVDWPQMFDFFKTHERLPDSKVKRMEFFTASPGISSHSGMLNILQQTEQLKISSVRYNHDLKQKKIKVRLENTSRFMLDFSSFKKNQPYELSLDSTDFKIQPGNDFKKYFRLENKNWIVEDKPSNNQKGPHRAGLFKSAFSNRMIFVYGTNGNKLENEWAFNKARYDAETFWYRGNGAVEIIADSEYSRDRYPSNNIILFGHQEMNSAWDLVLENCPIRIKRRQIAIGDQVLVGDDLAAYFIYPMANNEMNSVGVIAGTGMPGLKSASQNRYFTSGSGFPDFMIFRTAMLRHGNAGVVSAGFFDNTWNLNSKDSYIR